MTTVQDIMSRNVQTCTMDAKVVDVLNIMQTEDCGAVPLVENGTNVVQAIITDRDIALGMLNYSGQLVQDITVNRMVSAQGGIVSVRPEDDIRAALSIMEEHHVRRLPVCDINGQCVGILAQADIARMDVKGAGELVQSISQ